MRVSQSEGRGVRVSGSPGEMLSYNLIKLVFALIGFLLLAPLGSAGKSGTAFNEGRRVAGLLWCVVAICLTICYLALIARFVTQPSRHQDIAIVGRPIERIDPLLPVPHPRKPQMPRPSGRAR